MDYAFDMQDGRHFFMFTSGNDIILISAGTGRNVRRIKLANDYHASFTAIFYEGEIYAAYVSYLRELTLIKVMANEKIILLKVSNDGMEIKNLSFDIISGKIYLLFMVSAQNQKFTVKGYMLGKENESLCLMDDENIRDYSFFDIGNIKVFGTSYESGEYDYYRLDKENERFSLKKLIIDLEENVTKMIDSQHNIMEETIEKMKKEYSEKLRNEIEHQSDIFKNRYNKLVDTVKEIQNEGKRWRELYYENVKK